MTDENESTRGLTLAWTLTAGWLAAGAARICLDWEAVSKLKPNEMGDLAAGAFAPLAFLWLVYGFFLQRQELMLQRMELHASVKALEDQRDELRKQTKTSETLAEVTTNQLKLSQEQLDRYINEKRARFVLSGKPTFQHAGGILQCLGIKFKNVGADAFDVFASVDSYPPGHVQQGSPEVARGGNYHLNVAAQNRDIVFPLRVTLRWSDALMVENNESYEVIS